MDLSKKIVSKGYAIAPIYLFEPFPADAQESYIGQNEDAAAIDRYEKARDKALAELESIRERLGGTDPDKAKIFAAHIDILFDEAMDEEIRDLIRSERNTPEFAVKTVFTAYAKLLSKSKDTLISERAADLNDVRNRILRCFTGAPEKNISALDGPVILVAHDLLPSDTATLDRKNVRGILTEVGGATSHSAIIAKSYAIPAIIGVPGVMSALTHGEPAILDAVAGDLIQNPTCEQVRVYTQKLENWRIQKEEILRYQDALPLTRVGVRVDIGLNIATAPAQGQKGEPYADLVGLFRTEFLYMESDHLPTEEEQFQAYRRTLLAYGNKPVTMRTLDIGGDKTLPYLELPHEENPFLGNRAIRLCFTHPDIFRTQLRAAFRASVYGNLWLMLPMIGSLDDIRLAKSRIEDVKSELDREGIAYSKDVKIGIMIEIPSIAVVADLAAQEVDFASIGTNDLCQYLCAVDRLNSNVGGYYQSYHPALFRIMGNAIRAFRSAGKPISVCGELGGDPIGACVLVGLGLRKLSMNCASVATIKRVLSKFTIPQLEEMAKYACSAATARQTEEYLTARIGSADETLQP